jgi:hypothetical protein
MANPFDLGLDSFGRQDLRIVRVIDVGVKNLILPLSLGKAGTVAGWFLWRRFFRGRFLSWLGLFGFGRFRVRGSLRGWFCFCYKKGVKSYKSFK